MMLVSFAVVFAAGVVAGLLLARSARPAHRRSWLASELGLTPEQQQQMRKIWSEPDQRSAMRGDLERRRALRQWRDEALRALLTEEQKARHDALVHQYEQKLAELNEERRKAFEETMERTKEILTESQRKKYEKLLEWRHGLRGRTGGEPPHERGVRPGGGAPHRRGAGPGAGPFGPSRHTPAAEVQDGPGGPEKSKQE